jgi:hypothetical protein
MERSSQHRYPSKQEYRMNGAHIITVPATRRLGDSHVGEVTVRDFAAVEACLNCWMDARCNLVRARAERMADLRGAIFALL